MFKHLRNEHKQLLQAMAAGAMLKVHRTVDGGKVYRLHPLSVAAGVLVAEADVTRLQEFGLVESNMKFPAAVFLLTEKGLALAEAQTTPIGPRGFG